MTLMCIKQHLSNIWSSIHEKLSNADADLRKNRLIIKKKNVHFVGTFNESVFK